MAYAKPTKTDTFGTTQVRLQAKARLDRGQTSTFTGQLSGKITDILEAQLTVPCEDSYTPIIDFVGTGEGSSDGKSLGSLSNEASGARFIGINNTGTCSLDIGFRNQQWYGGGGADTEFTSNGSNYVKSCITSFLLHPGQFIALPTNRMVTYNPTTDTANESACTAQEVDGEVSSTTTDGTGYAKSEDHGWTATGEGIVPGSMVLAFCRPAYATLGLSARATSSQSSGLAANTAYTFRLTVDGSATSDISFTTDATDVTWGGTNGVMKKINAALVAAGHLYTMKIAPESVYYDDADAGDIVMVHNKAIVGTSTMAFTAPGGGTTMFGVGLIPAVGSTASVAPSYLLEKEYLAYDNGYGDIYRLNGGKGILKYAPAHNTTLYSMPAYSSIKAWFRMGSAHSGPTEGTAGSGRNILSNILATTIHPGGTAHDLKDSFGQITVTLFS